MSNTPLTILHGGHRKVLRIGANDSMSTVVQMACREFGLDAGGSSNLVLKHKRTVVDLSQPFRFTGIPQNATLELTEGTPARGKAANSAAGGQVRVAMRMPGGGRVQAAFSSDTTLLGLLNWWAERGELDAGVLEQGPSLQFMRTAYGAAELGSTTLRSIGLVTGSAMFALSLACAGCFFSIGASTAYFPLAAQQNLPGATKRFHSRTLQIPSLPPPLIRSPARTPSSEKTTTDRGATAVPAATTGSAAARGAASGSAVSAPVPLPSTAAAATPIAATAMDVAPSTEAAGPAAGGERGDGAAAGAASREGGPAEAGAMDVDTPSVPAMGIDVCRAALEAMAAGHFDADSEACVVTLAKVVDNVLHRPDDARTRQIRLGNAAFMQKVGRITGGISFLEGVGFVSRDGAPQQQLLSGGGGGGGGGTGDRCLVLSPEREDSSLLKQARVLLSKQAGALGVPPERMPQPPRPRPVAPPPAAGQAAFDPYKPFMTSTAPTPKGPQEQSLTEKRLQELLAKRADVVSGGVPDRDIRVVLPSQAAAAAAAAAAASSSDGALSQGGASGVGGGGGSGQGGVDGERGDKSLLAKKVARQMAERKKQDDVPFQTKAMREIERLQKATVYRTTLIKVQFPDRVVLQATFASTEGVKDLLEVVRSSLGDHSKERALELYVSPPRTVLKAASSLSDAGLVPAALVYVSWREVPPSGEAEGAYLKPELTCGSGGAGAGAGAASTVARPVGVALADGGARGSEESKRAGGGARGGAGGSGRSGSGGGKRAGKPSWLKIN
ncbi:unnamed protein product [Scytosiphon promiscuus]